MSRIVETFARLKKAGRLAFIPYATIGFPSLHTAEELVPALIAAGGDLVELGVPFSDPLADGPTVQRASFVALQNGVTRAKCFEAARTIRSQTDAPLIFMGYYNPVFSYGVERYVQEAAESGVDGLIIPDLSPEEADEVVAACRKADLDYIFLLAPTSTDARIEQVAKLASGFIYCVSVVGVTGARDALSATLPDFIARIRKHTDLPLVVGFGISRPEHIQTVAKFADGVVVASALLNAIEQVPASEVVTTATSFVKHLLS
jgi:tryptophan synthase alpha chain